MTPAHTDHRFESELRELKDRLLGMGGRCERAIRLAVQAVEERDHELASAVEVQERLTNVDEVEIDDLAERILALRQPMGRDLRFTLVALKVVTDLERIADQALNVAERVPLLASAQRVPAQVAELPAMARLASEMLHDALDAFLDEDAASAGRVLPRDDEVDEAYSRILRDVAGFMAEQPEAIDAAMAVCSCAKYLERIADHATNIAERVVYLARGVDVRHGGGPEAAG